MPNVRFIFSMNLCQQQKTLYQSVVEPLGQHAANMQCGAAATSSDTIVTSSSTSLANSDLKTFSSAVSQSLKLEEDGFDPHLQQGQGHQHHHHPQEQHQMHQELSSHSEVMMN